MKKSNDMPKFMGHYFEQGSNYRYSLMREESITIVFTDREEIQIPLGTKYTLGSIEGLPGSAAGTYILLTPPSVTIDEVTGGRTHSVTLDKEYWALKGFIFKFYTKYKATAEKPAYAKKEASWSLTAHIGTFAKVLKDNLADAQCGVTDVQVDSVGTGGAQSLSFSSTSILDAINKIASQWKCEWWVDGSVLHFGKCEKGTAVGFESHIESSDPIAGTVTPNKWYVFGSTRNIPYWYKKSVNTEGVDLTFDNYRHELDGELTLTAFGNEGKQSLIGEGDHTTFIDYGMKTSVTPNTYVWIDFAGCTADYARSAGFNGEVYAYLQYSGDNKEYITMQRMKVSDVVGDTTFSKTKTYFKAETGMVYLRMLIELHTDEDNEKGYINISPTFAPKVYKVKNTGLKLGTLPMSCFESAELGDDSLSSAVVQNRLMLENAIDLTDGGMIREGVVVFDDIYPKSIHSVELLDSKEYIEEVELADGTKEKRPWRAYRMKAPSFLTIDDIISGKTLAVHFETGPLAGMEFDVSLTKEQYEDGVLEIIRNDKYGRWLPDATLSPQGTYALLNFDVSSGLGDIMADAEDELKEAAEDYISTVTKDGDNRECTMMVDIETAYEIGDAVDSGVTGPGRIVSLEIPLDIPYDHPKYTIGNSADYSRFGDLKTQIEGNVKDGTDYAGGASIYVIRRNDSTDPTNDNVYSAKRSDENYLSKVVDDSVKGYIAFAKGLASMGIISSVDKVITMKSFESGDYKRLEKGFYLGPELIPEKAQKQESRLEVDNLYVRNAIQYRMLNIKRRTYIGGSLVVTCGSAEIIEAWTKAEAQDRITAIEEELAILGDETEFEKKRQEELTKELEKLSAIPDGVSRCYFLNEHEGMKINNEFVPGDFACNETLNLEEQSYYWRAVVNAGPDWVDLSLTDCDTSRENDEPQAGDVIVQLGHVKQEDETDEYSAGRQNAIFIKADSTDAPAILTYHGINSFSLEDHEAIMQKFDKVSGTMKLTVYGDCYVGDKTENSFIKFTQGEGLEVQANKISLKSGPGTSEDGDDHIDIKDFIESVKPEDGDSYSIWFADHIPTNDNYPAVDWVTDEEKDAHEGDLLYYRFLGRAYKYTGRQWVEITDQDTKRALEQIHEKKRIFCEQPAPPYDRGDMWVNASYPDAGYNNDTLRCIVTRGEDEEFHIEDWVPVSFMTQSFFEQRANEIMHYVDAVSEDHAVNLRSELTTRINEDYAEILGIAKASETRSIAAEGKANEAVRTSESASGVAAQAKAESASAKLFAEHAEEFASAAEEAANGARDSAKYYSDVAVEAKDGAATAELQAKGYSDNAKSYQDGAADYYTQAQTQAGLAAEASENAASALLSAQTEVTKAKGHADDAEGYMETAKTQAALALTSEQNAAAALLSAQGEVTKASGYADDAKGYWEKAGGEAALALEYKNGAAEAELSAKSYSETADGHREAAAGFSTSANAAKTAAETAQGKAEGAQAAAEKVLADAKIWAESDGSAASIIAKVVKENETVRSEIEAIADEITFTAELINFVTKGLGDDKYINISGETMIFGQDSSGQNKIDTTTTISNAGVYTSYGRGGYGSFNGPTLTCSSSDYYGTTEITGGYISCEKISASNLFSMEKVSALPSNPDPNTLYIVI